MIPFVYHLCILRYVSLLTIRRRCEKFFDYLFIGSNSCVIHVLHSSINGSTNGSNHEYSNWYSRRSRLIFSIIHCITGKKFIFYYLIYIYFLVTNCNFFFGACYNLKDFQWFKEKMIIKIICYLLAKSQGLFK